jgi:hypothetical protein
VSEAEGGDSNGHEHENVEQAFNAISPGLYINIKILSALVQTGTIREISPLTRYRTAAKLMGS